MNQVLNGEVRHPSELFKGPQVFKLSLEKIRHLNSVDVFDLALHNGALISGLLLNGAKISFKSGRGRRLL